MQIDVERVAEMGAMVDLEEKLSVVKVSFPQVKSVEIKDKKPLVIYQLQMIIVSPRYLLQFFIFHILKN